MKIFFPILCALLLTFTLTAQQEELELTELPLRNGGTQLYAQNNSFCPISMSLNLKVQTNIRTDKSLPYQIIIPADGEPHKVIRMEPKNTYKDSRYEYEFTYVLGDVNAVHDDTQAYLLPYRHGTSAPIGQGYNGRYSHKGLYCLDFDLPKGTNVHAARGGVVVSIKENSKSGCKHPRCKSWANYIVICHDDGTMANYIHLQHRGSLVEVGQQVKAGEIIGKSGNTGWSSGPHLHFEVFVQKMGSTQSIPTKFLVGDGQSKQLQEKQSYTAVHPEK